MAIKNSLGGISWSQWPADLRRRVPQAIEEKKKELAEEIQFIRFQQYEFTKQWTKLKKYANDQGIRIIGDIPIYVAFDSADAWVYAHSCGRLSSRCFRSYRPALGKSSL